jgi:hypothetical protein
MKFTIRDLCWLAILACMIAYAVHLSARVRRLESRLHLAESSIDGGWIRLKPETQWDQK